MGHGGQEFLPLFLQEVALGFGFSQAAAQLVQAACQKAQLIVLGESRAPFVVA